VSTTPGIDPSWSPRDPDQLLYIGCPTWPCIVTETEVYRIPINGGASTRLTFNSRRDNDPYLSNSGRRIAWEQDQTASVNAGRDSWSLWVMAADGGSGTLTSDHAISSVPQWSWPNDDWIYFHRVMPPATHFGIYRIRPDDWIFEPVVVDDGWHNENPTL
jgi:TolB protein